MDCDDPKLPEVCPDGKYPNPSAIGCRNCEKGFYCKHGIKTECPPGTYCSRYDMSMPLQCWAGSYCKGGSQFNPEPCPEKTYSEGRYGLNEPNRPLEGWSECKSCPAGFVCDGGIKENCPKGSDNRYNLVQISCKFSLHRCRLRMFYNL